MTDIFRKMAEVHMNLKPGEDVLFATDYAVDPKMVQAMAQAIHATGAICTVCLQPNAGFDKDDMYALTAPMRNAYNSADVVIVAGQASPATLYGRPQEYRDKIQSGQGTRMFSLLQVPLDLLIADDADYFRIRENNLQLKTLLTQSREIRITTPGGTDFKGELQGVPWDQFWGTLSHDGFADEPGTFGAFPDGEVHWPCPPESMEGTVVIDGPVHNICHTPDQPIVITVESGRIVQIEGGQDADQLRQMLKTLDQEYTSEIGFGTNPVWSGWSNSVHCMKKGLGNLHVAYGGWWGKQPSIPYKVHGDMIMLNGKVEVDGQTIVENNQLLWPEDSGTS